MRLSKFNLSTSLRGGVLSRRSNDVSWSCFAVVALCFLTYCAPAQPALVVSAASDLQNAFTELGAAFENETGAHIAFNFGSSGLLAQQIAQGAPVDLFASANRAYVDDLAARGIIFSDSVRVYARGRIVLLARDATVQSLADLARADIARIAIANPEHAPYGVAAREAMQNAGVWQTVQTKMALAENIQQAKQYFDTGNVDAAIIAQSLVRDDPRAILIPQELYRPLDQAIGVVKNSRNEKTARAFADYIISARGRAVLQKFGFEIP
ncbi:MAG: molybdate ABC transporter substrate-binding protein [Chloroflexi bacterium]|nr:molybdate ABC transporter substrate-binding protein [Chloroflexota bacterium]